LMFDEFVLRQSLDDDSMPNKRMTGILVYARACRPRLVALGSADSFVNGIRNVTSLFSFLVRSESKQSV